MTGFAGLRGDEVAIALANRRWMRTVMAGCARAIGLAVIEGHRRPFGCDVAAIAGICCIEVCIAFAQSWRMCIVMATEARALCLGVVEGDGGPVRRHVARRAIIGSFEMVIGFAQGRCMVRCTIMATEATCGGNNSVVVVEGHSRCPSCEACMAKRAVV